MRRAWPWLLISVLTSPPAAAEEPAIVAVFDVELSGVRLSDERLATLDDYLHRKLASGSRFSVVPRSEVRKRLRREKAESYSECYDQSCQIEIGKELAAQMTVSAKVLRIGDECLVSLLLYDLRTAASAGATEATGGCNRSGLVRSVETAALALAEPAPARVAPKRMGVEDPKLCKEPDTRRVGDPPPKGRHFYCVNADNQRHGPSVAFHANGEVAVRETYVDGVAQGTQARFHVNGKPAERGEVVDGKRTGIWTRWSQQGSKTEQGPYVGGVRSGDWEVFDYRRGYVKEIVRYERDLRHGPTKGRREDGSVRYRGEHVDGERSGTWTWFDERGERTSTTEYRAGQRHGLVVQFDEEGEPKSEETYVAGAREGPAKRWRRTDGVRYLASTKTYLAGEEHGVSTSFTSEGAKRSQTTYRKGERDGRYVEYRTRDGVTYAAKVGDYVDGKKSGVWREYSAPEQLTSETTYAGGVKSGPFTVYDRRDGHKRESGTYVDNRKHGWVQRYGADGEPSSRVRYDKGRRQR